MTGGNFLTRHTGRATPALGTAARNALGPQFRPLRKRLAFLNKSWFDSQNFCFARLNVTCGNSPDSSRNDRLGHNGAQQFFYQGPGHHAKGSSSQTSGAIRKFRLLD